MPYGGSPGSDTSDAIRLLVGDISTSTGGEYLSDTDYDFFAAQTGNIYVAAQLASNSLAALFMGSAASASGSGYTEKAVGDLRLKKADAVQVAGQYRALAQKFARMAASKVAPSAGGISISEKQANRADSDLVAPYFQRGLMDNPESTPLNLHVTSDIDEIS